MCLEAATVAAGASLDERRSRFRAQVHPDLLGGAKPDPGERRHVPEVIAIDVDLPPQREQVERGDPEVVDRAGRPRRSVRTPRRGWGALVVLDTKAELSSVVGHRLVVELVPREVWPERVGLGINSLG